MATDYAGMTAASSLPLFVYGTLRSGGSNAHVLHALGAHPLGALTLPKQAQLALVHIPTLHYPHIVTANRGFPASTIHGELFTIPETAWPELDAFEDVDAEYQRCAPATYAEHTFYYYCAHPKFDLSTATIIYRGDWLNYLSDEK